MEHTLTLTVSLEPEMTASLDPRPHPTLHSGDRVIWKVVVAKASQIELGFRGPRHPFVDFSKDEALNQISFAVEDRPEGYEPEGYKCFVLYNHGELAWPGEGVNIPVDPPRR